MKKKAQDDIVKTTIRVPRELWNKARHRAIEEGVAVQDVLVAALEQYLKKGGRS